MSAFSDSVESQWYTRPHWLLLLAPFSILFSVIAYLRRLRYTLSQTCPVSVPVIVVGNITVGGTGKTPIIVALVRYLTTQGFHPGIISRGYGAHVAHNCLVSPTSNPAEVGDEPLLLAQVTGCPVVVGIDRVKSAQYLTTQTSCDIILSDDGLQHYALFRDIEIAVVDSQRQLGNGWRLPVGPLRESKQRLREVDFVIVNGELIVQSWLPEGKTFFAEIKPKLWRNVKTGEACALNDLDIRQAQAVAGIGNPQRFFSCLNNMGFQGDGQAFPDHYSYSSSDFLLVDGMLLMTEKDAVKCKAFAKDNWWALSIEIDIEEAFLSRLHQQIQGMK